MENENVPVELVEDEDIKQSILDQLEESNNDDENDLSLLNPNELVKLKSEFEEHDQTISDELNSVSTSYFNIGYELISMSKMDLTLFGYRNIYDYGNSKYNLKTTSIKNMMNVVKKCCIEDTDGCLDVKPEYADFSYSQLVELLSVEDKDLINFDSSMTIKQIRENKVLIKMNEFYCKEVQSEIRSFRDFVDATFIKPANILGVVIEPTAEENHFLEMCDSLGECKIEILFNDVSDSDYVYKYEYYLKISYANYKKYPFEVKFYLTYNSEINFFESICDFSYWFSSPSYESKYISIDGEYRKFSEIRKFFSCYLDSLEKFKKRKEQEKLEKENRVVEKAKQEKLDNIYKEIKDKGLMCYGDNKKLLNSHSGIKDILKAATKHIDILADDEICVYGDSFFPIPRLKIVGCYYLNLRYMCIEMKNDNSNYFNSTCDGYKTKEYYQLLFDYIKKFQAADTAKTDESNN